MTPLAPIATDGAQREDPLALSHPPQVVAVARRPGRLPYLPVRLKFALTLLAGFAWAAFSLHMASPWIRDLGRVIGTVGAHLVIWGVAILPGC